MTIFKACVECFPGFKTPGSERAIRKPLFLTEKEKSITTAKGYNYRNLRRVMEGTSTDSRLAGGKITEFGLVRLWCFGT
jgi:hypothetical protein